VDEVVVDAPVDVAAVLADPRLVPHRSADPSSGATIRLRAAMARFSEPSAHPPRRAAVVDVVAGLDLVELRTVAAQLTAASLRGDEVDVLRDVAGVVPTAALWRALRLPEPVAIADVEAVVRVIGRGQPATPAADAATERLLEVAGGDVAVVSALYQNFDATAALIASTLGTGDPPAPAVPRTRRVAVGDVVVAGRSVPTGTTLVVEIGAAGLPFGAGPHECPGRLAAEAIVGGVVDAVATSGFHVDPADTVLDADGRPTRLVARRSRPVAP
jgi:hypothetical protein